MKDWSALRARFSHWLKGAEDKPVDVLPVRVSGTEYRQTRALPPAALGLDQALIWVVIGLLAWGLVMVYSASIAMPDNPRFGKIEHYHFLLRHSMALGVGFVGALMAFQISMKTWERLAVPMFLVALFLLVLVLVPGVGLVVNGARRWLPLGVMNFQPSELAKFAVLIYAANYMVRRMDVKERFFRAVWPMAVAVVMVGVLLLAEPDMGAFIVIVVISMGILFLGGVNARMFFLMAALVVAAFVTMIALSPWRRERIFAYLDPFSADHALGKGYQLSHALIAIGRGEMFGVGLGRSVEKLHWLPEAHTDFLLSVIVRLCRHLAADHCLCVADPSHYRNRPRSHCAGPCVLWSGRAGRRAVVWLPGFHQHGCEPGRLAHQGSDAAVDEFWWLGHFDELDRRSRGAAD